MSSYSPPGIDPKSKLGKSRNINPKFKKKNAKKRERWKKVCWKRERERESVDWIERE